MRRIALLALLIILLPTTTMAEMDLEQWRKDHVKHLNGLAAILDEYAPEGQPPVIPDYKYNSNKNNQKYLIDRMYRREKYMPTYRSPYMRQKFPFGRK
jgi:hypothetical protein